MSPGISGSVYVPGMQAAGAAKAYRRLAPTTRRRLELSGVRGREMTPLDESNITRTAG